MKILLLARHTEREKIFRYHASESMLLGLEEAGIDFDIHIPWKPFAGNIHDYDAMLVWSYQGKRKNFTYWAKQFEKEVRDAGVPVINSVNGCFYMHSTCLGRWRDAGVPCAKFQFFKTFEDINLRYPMILRTDGLHEGKNTHLVNNPDEARAAIDRATYIYMNTNPREKAIRLLNLAIEYHDVIAPDGYYHKQRTIVVGDTLIHREHSVATGWLVNLGNRVYGDYVQNLNREFFNTGDKNRELILKAARALGSDVVALDYTVLPNGDCMFWEGNRHFKMHGNETFKPGEINPATGRDYTEMVNVDRAVGRAIVDLLYQVTDKTKELA